MTAKGVSVPEGFGGVTPYLCCKGAAEAIDFYKQAFGAKEKTRLNEPGGKVAHAEIVIGGAVVMLADEYPDYGVLSPKTIGGSPVMMHLYVDDVDAFFQKAVAAGAMAKQPPADQFYGDRSASLEDPFGHRWMIATHKEDVSAEELQRRFAAMAKP